jgi:transposase
MLTCPGLLKVFLAMDEADLRKSFTGLWAVKGNVLKDDPSTGALYLYTNRRHNRVKALYWGGTGLWVMTKRLEQGTFNWPRERSICLSSLSRTLRRRTEAYHGTRLKDPGMPSPFA